MSKVMNRRNFGKTLSSLSLFTLGAGELGCDQHSADFNHAAAPDTGGFGRISLNAYCFNSALNDLTKNRNATSCVKDLFDVLDFAALYHIDAIDPTGYFWPGFPQPPDPIYLTDFLQKAQDLGIAVSGTGARNDFAQVDPAARAHDIRIVGAWCEVAAALNAPVLRVFAGPVPIGYEQRWEEVATWMAEDLRQCAEIGKANGVKVGIQNHGDMLRSSDQIIRMLEMVDHDWLGVINDTGYYSTPDPYVDIERIMPYTISIQLKESVRPVKKQHPFVTDLPRLLTIIKNSGYRGYLPIETLPTVDEHSGTGVGDYNPSLAVQSFLVKVRDAVQLVSGQAVAETPGPIVCAPGEKLTP
jgi:sugar phosphate isomerase/epimerase